MFEATLALLILLVFLVFWGIRRTYGFWHGKGIPYLSFTEYVKVVYDNFTKPLHNVVRKNYRQHGRLYGSYQGFVPTLVVGDPLLLRDIYVKDFKSFTDRIESKATGNAVWDKMMLNNPGEEWKATRSMMSPVFTTSRLKAMIPKIIATTNEFCKRLQTEGEKNSAVEIFEMFEVCAMDTTAALVYSLDLNTHENLDHPLVKCCKGFFGNLGGWKMILFFSMSRVFKMLPLEFPSKKGTEYIKEFTRHMAKQRCASKESYEDVLQLCLDSVLHGRPDNFELSDSAIEDIGAQCMLFFVAGSDTVAHTLTLMAYTLALHPECQERVLEEIDNAVKEKGVTYETLKEMPYLEAAINEVLRLYSPDSFLVRRCTQETTVSGVTIRPGMMIEIPIEGMHHDPEFFPEPDCFKPERFLPENKEAIVPYTYLAFGAGPRNCVGQRMGMIQAKAALACLLQKIKFEKCSETPVPLKPKKRSLVIQFADPVKVRCVPRMR